MSTGKKEPHQSAKTSPHDAVALPKTSTESGQSKDALDAMLSHALSSRGPALPAEEAASNAAPAGEQRCGLIAIVGKPNVGKSTLLNALVGQKVSITSRKAQTTRHRITGMRTRDATQFVFVDTPGFQTRHGNALNR